MKKEDEMNKQKQYMLMDPMTYEKHMSRIAHTTHEEKRQNDMDLEMRNILESQDGDDIKVLKYSQVLAKMRNIRKPLEDNIIDEKYILDSISENVRHKAKRLLDKVKESNELGWNKYGELIYEQTPIPKSNIVQLLTDILKTRTYEKPVGWHDFAEALAGSIDRIDKDIVPNQSSWKIMSGKTKGSARGTTSRTHDITDSASKSEKGKRKRRLTQRDVEDERQRQLTLDTWQQY